MLSEKQIVVRLPEELLQKVDAMIPVLKQRMDSLERITRSHVVRVALIQGLGWLEEQCFEDQEGREVLRDRVSQMIREELTRLNSSGHLAGGDIEENLKKRLRLKNKSKPI